MKKVCIYLLVLFSSSVFGQNFVNNWSFEDTVACPSAMLIDKSQGWMVFKNSPDYYNDCNSLNFGMPNNMVGFQYAKSGIAYGGFVAKSLGTLNFHEIIGSQLNQQLVIGQLYYISFYVNRAYKSGFYNNMAVNKLGLKFSTIPYPNYFTNPIAINNMAHVYTDNIVSDTIGWIKISGTFTADSAYNYLAIGNFFDDSLTMQIKFDSIASFAYYYVDDVCVSSDSNYCNLISGLTHVNNKTPFKVFPNPVNDELNIEGIGFTEIIIYDDFGKIVFIMKTSHAIYSTKIQLPYLSRGLYAIKIKTLNSFYTKKIIHN